jgi:hypothetical protein
MPHRQADGIWPPHASATCTRRSDVADPRNAGARWHQRCAARCRAPGQARAPTKDPDAWTPAVATRRNARDRRLPLADLDWGDRASKFAHSFQCRCSDSQRLSPTAVYAATLAPARRHGGRRAQSWREIDHEKAGRARREQGGTPDHGSTCQGKTPKPPIYNPTFGTAGIDGISANPTRRVKRPDCAPTLLPAFSEDLGEPSGFFDANRRYRCLAHVGRLRLRRSRYGIEACGEAYAKG